MRLIYWVPYHLVGLQLWLHGMTVQGYERLPKGGCLLVANHASYLDPTTVGWAVGREIFYLARRTIFQPPFLNWFLPMVNVLPIDRDGHDLSAMRKMIRTLKEGHTVLLFPEGTRTPDGQLQPAQPGAGFIALKAGVPIVPVRVFGTFAAFSKSSRTYKFLPLRVVIGQPYQAEVPAGLKEKDAYPVIAQQMMEKIGKLS